MRKIKIDTPDNNSLIIIGEKWKNYGKYVSARNAVIITDDNVLRLYGRRFPVFPILSITPGEKSKRLDVINDLAVKLMDLGIDRKSFIVGIGGGVVCDIAGFLASVYMRGISFGFVSTSLLSQVDASVGGKNGVNVGSVKNILGNFKQPEFVICDPEILKTLPDDEYLSGLSELIKMGFILDIGLVEMIEQNVEPILNRESALLTKLIARSIELKASVVREDEKESGIRMILNFGHTFGHAIETNGGFKHGFAVAVGMIIAADISVEMGILNPVERNRLYSLLDSFKLISKYSISYEKMNELICRDKKKSGETINFVMLEKTGSAAVLNIDVAKLVDYYKNIG